MNANPLRQVRRRPLEGAPGRAAPLTSEPDIDQLERPAISAIGGRSNVMAPSLDARNAKSTTVTAPSSHRAAKGQSGNPRVALKLQSVASSAVAQASKMLRQSRSLGPRSRRQKT